MNTTADHFDPPFESPIEEIFAWNIAKYLREDVRFEKQIDISTLHGAFRVDFVAIVDDARIGFECDGEQFHDEFRDECRDAIILGEGHLEAIYRIRGKDIHHHVNDCLYLVSKRDGNLFSPRGTANLDILASTRTKWLSDNRDDTVLLSYPDSSHNYPGSTLVLERRSRFVPEGQRRHWQALYAFAVQNNVANVDELVELRKRAWTAGSFDHPPLGM